MLEERLSNTYNQHTIRGYSFAPQRASSGIYPSISSNPPNGVGGAAESFYTGNPQPESYGRPQSMYYPPTQQQYQNPNKNASIANPGYSVPEQRSDSYNQYPPQSHQPQQPQTGGWQPSDPSATPTAANPGYSAPEQRSDNYNQYPQPGQQQRSGSWQATDGAPAPYQAQPPNYPPESAPQPPLAHQNVPSQPSSNYTPSEAALTPSADPNAAFYYGNTSQAPPSQQISPPQQVPEQSQPQYPPTRSPQQFHSSVAQASPQQFKHQPLKQQQQPQQVPSAASQPPYWQAQQQNPPPQQWQAPGQTYGGYTQESFPSAPHHAPQQQAVEESLIDL